MLPVSDWPGLGSGPPLNQSLTWARSQVVGSTPVHPMYTENRKGVLIQGSIGRALHVAKSVRWGDLILQPHLCLNSFPLALKTSRKQVLPLSWLPPSLAPRARPQWQLSYQCGKVQETEVWPHQHNSFPFMTQGKGPFLNFYFVFGSSWWRRL